MHDRGLTSACIGGTKQSNEKECPRKNPCKIHGRLSLLLFIGCHKVLFYGEIDLGIFLIFFRKFGLTCIVMAIVEAP